MKRVFVLIFILTILFTTACRHIDDVFGSGRDPIDDIKYVVPSTTSAEESNTPVLMDMWELTDVIKIEPKTYEIGDDLDNSLYTFEYTQNNIYCTIKRTVYDGKSKPNLEETIEMSGYWSEPTEEAYLPNEMIKLSIGAQINSFERLSSDLSKNGTNFAGVSVWAYITNSIGNDIGNPPEGYLKSNENISTVTAEIKEGKIYSVSEALEVMGTFGNGKTGDQKALCIVVSTQGRIGGIKYIYKYID